MLNRPKLKHCFQPIQLAVLPDIFLLTERNSVLLSDRLSEFLIPLLNGHQTVDEIVDLLQAKVAAAEVYYALMWMEQHGYITERDLESEDLLTSDFVIFCRPDVFAWKNRLLAMPSSTFATEPTNRTVYCQSTSFHHSIISTGIFVYYPPNRLKCGSYRTL